MRRRFVAKLIQIAALVVILLAAEAAIVLHDDGEQSHPAGEVCAVCIGVASLGAGNVAAAAHVDVVRQAATPVRYAFHPAAARRAERRLARGPPPTS